MGATSIQWTDETWNPTTGCTKVSQGCKHCYAERVFPRVYGSRKFTDVRTHRERLDQPLGWKRPRRVFVNSMSDLFHEDVPDAFIDRVFAVMDQAERHVFQILTKRPERMRAYCARINGAPLANVWLGVSVEDQPTADERISWLLRTPAAVRFVSYEPALGPVDFRGALKYAQDGIDWVIVGGESGPNARPFDVAWARSTIAQCRAVGVACFVKQLGVVTCGLGRGRWKDRAGGDPNEWPADLRVREFPESKR